MKRLIVIPLLLFFLLVGTSLATEYEIKRIDGLEKNLFDVHIVDDKAFVVYKDSVDKKDIEDNIKERKSNKKEIKKLLKEEFKESNLKNDPTLWDKVKDIFINPKEGFQVELTDYLHKIGDKSIIITQKGGFADIYDNHTVFFNFTKNNNSIGDFILNVVYKENSSASWKNATGVVLVDLNNGEYKLNFTDVVKEGFYGFQAKTDLRSVMKGETDYSFLLYNNQQAYFNNSLFCQQSLDQTNSSCFVESVDGYLTIVGYFNDSFDPTITLLPYSDFNSITTHNITSHDNFSHLNLEDSTIAGYWNFNADGEEKRQKGVVGTYIDFNGVDEYLSIPDDNSLDVGTGEYSVSFWTRGGGSSDALFFKSDWYPTTGINVYKWINQVFYDCGPSQAKSVTYNSANYQHVVVTKDSSNIVNVYINNTVGTQSCTDSRNLSNSQDLNLGASSDSIPKEFFTGDLDEVMFFNRTLTSAERQEIYESNLQRAEANVKEDLQAYYKLDEVTGQTILDSSDNSNDGEYINYQPIYSYDFSGNENTATYAGTANNNATFKSHALWLDGDSDYVSYDTVYFSNFTVAFWVNADTPGANQILFNTKSSDFNGVYIQTVSNFLRLSVNGTILSDPGGYGSANVWYHYAIKLNGTNATIYRDGVKKASGIVNKPDQTASFGTTSYIGAYSSGGFWFDGMMDDFLLYDRPLTETEITALYNNQSPNYSPTGLKYSPNIDFNVTSCTGVCDQITLNNTVIKDEPSGTSLSLRVDYWEGNTTGGYDLVQPLSEGLIGYWAADGSAKDETGNNDGSFNDDANASEKGIYANAFGLDGASDSISVSNPSELDGLESATFSLWLNHTNSVGNDEFLSRWGAQHQFLFRMDAFNDLILAIADSVGDAGLNYGVVSTGINDNEWNHITIVYNGSGITNADRLFCYVNGEKKSVSIVGTIRSNLTTSTSDLLIGASSVGNYFEGLIDDVKIWNRTLSVEEINQNYRRGLANWQIGDIGDGVYGENYSVTNKTEKISPVILMSSQPNNIDTPIFKGDVIASFTTSVPPEPIPLINTSINHFDFDVENFTISGSTYVPVFNSTFNLSQLDQLYFFGTGNTQKTGGGGTNQLYLRLDLNGVTLFDQLVRSMTGSSDIGVFSIPFSTATGIDSTNVITLYAREVGSQGVEVTNFEFHALQNKSNESFGVPMNKGSFNTSQAGTDYELVYQTTIPSFVYNAKNYIDVEHKIQSTGTALTFCYWNLTNQYGGSECSSPQYGRSISSGQTGSMGISFVDSCSNTSIAPRLYCHSDGTENITHEVTILAFTAKDIGNNVINIENATNPTTSEDSPKDYSAGTHSIVNLTNYMHKDGDETHISFSLTVGSESGTQTPQFYINVSNDITEISNVFSRYLPADGVGNIKIYASINTTLLENYNVSGHLVVPSGEVVRVYDESLVAYDVVEKEISKTPFDFLIEFSNNNASPESPQVYNEDAKYNFTISVSSIKPIDTIYLEWNSGINYTMNQIANTSDYYYTLSNLSIGNYTYRYWANNSVGREDYSQNFTYNITNLTFTPRLIVTRMLPLSDLFVRQNNSFTYKVNVTCKNDDCGPVSVDVTANSTTISNVPGAIPFDTDITNPFVVNLTEDQQAIFTHSITANGAIGTYWNVTTFAELVSDNTTFNYSDDLIVEIRKGIGAIFNFTFIESESDTAKFTFQSGQT